MAAEHTQPTLFDPVPEPPTNPMGGPGQATHVSISVTALSDKSAGLGTTSKVPFGVALLALGAVKGLGQKSLQSLVSLYHDDLGCIFRLGEAELADSFRGCGMLGAEKFAAAVAHDPDTLLGRGYEELRRLEGRDIHVIPPSRLPARLRSIDGDAPGWLCVEGNETVLADRPVIAVVGTRNPSERGLDAARIVATVLSTYPVLLVSGLAEGIDSRAHHVSLQKGLRNVAFLGHGINLVFPETTADVRHEIVRQGGAIVSEYLPGQHYQKRQFVERNRLQAALADIVIPVEAAASSGTAHTIGFARRYSRPLVGLTWPGANGIVDDLRAHNDPLIDIFTSAGQRDLDARVRRLLEQERVDPYPFKNLERLVLREFTNRTYSQRDLDRFTETITREARPERPQESSGDVGT